MFSRNKQLLYPVTCAAFYLNKTVIKSQFAAYLCLPKAVAGALERKARYQIAIVRRFAPEHNKLTSSNRTMTRPPVESIDSPVWI